MRLFRCQLGSLIVSAMIAVSSAFCTEIWPQGLQRVRQKAATPLRLTDDGGAAADIVLLSNSELVRNAADWIADFTRRTSGAVVPIGDKEQLKPGRRHIVAVVGDRDPLVQRLAAAGAIQLEPLVSPQGFVIQRVTDAQLGDLLICWSPEPLGCRYGLIEVLRSLAVEGKSVQTSLGRVVERPQFPMRICYVNFAEHLQNAYNPNLLFDTPVNRWSDAQWERFIDMISAYRYNIFEFWLVPTLVSPEALHDGKIQSQFAETMNHVIAYAHRCGVTVHPIVPVNTVGEKWHYHCPNDPKEHAELVALWDYWSRALKDLDSFAFGPGDPGGCCRNGCTAETFVDFCIELSKVVRKNNPNMRIEINTWGEPFAGWGVPLWSGNRQRAEKSMQYLLSKLPAFPSDTFLSINQGFNPDCKPDGGYGGDGRPFAKEAAKTVPVLTWDYSVTEGEGTVSPRGRVQRIFQQRRAELALGCYSGGICYTMTPKLNCLNIFCCAEAWWNPALEPDAVLADFGRLVFGDKLAAIGPLMEEFEVIPDWGYYAPFPYSPERLQKSMSKLLPLLEKVNPQSQPRLPLAPTMAEYRTSLLYFASLFEKLGAISADLDKASNLAKTSGKLAAKQQGILYLDQLEDVLATPGDFPQKAALGALLSRLRQYDVKSLKKQYTDTVYGIYDAIPNPVDPRNGAAVSALFARFNCDAMLPASSVLQSALRATGKPHLLVVLGHPGSEGAWKLTGWTMQGEDNGVRWRASGDQPGLLVREDFHDKGYKWLVLRLTEGPAGGRKTISINGHVVGRFVRTGPAFGVKPEWFVTSCYPIPKGLLNSGKLEIRFSDSGIAIAEVALSAERVPDTQ